MIRGYFKQKDRNPYLAVEVILPEFSISQRVRFLVDTGASTTIINEGDALRLGLNFSKLKKADIKIGGIGGFAETYEADGILLSEVKPIYSGAIYFLKHHILSEISEDEQQKMKKWFLSQPSLLGKNIIYEYSLFMHYLSEKMLLLEDHEIPSELR